jgi:hypothetical protein
MQFYIHRNIGNSIYNNILYWVPQNSRNNVVYSERQKYGINSLKIKQSFFQKNLWAGQF